MSRSLSYLRRGLLGIAFLGSMGFGASQALASPFSPEGQHCQQDGYGHFYCWWECSANGAIDGYCGALGCECVYPEG